ncbi:coiled-coil domain-containing protein 17 [Chlamydotis macqueenii]
MRGQRGLGRTRGPPLGDVLTRRERALLHPADPASRRLTAEQGEPSRQPAPRQGHGQRPQELLEAHERHVAEIRARTQQLEQQREGLCQRLAALQAQAAADPHPEQEALELGRALEMLGDRTGPLVHGGAALCLDTLPPAAGPLAAEARALRLAYLRAGGHDAAILAQLLHLQTEATALETGAVELRRGRRPEPPGTGAQGLDAALVAVELENRRLEDELLALKVRRERRANAGSQVAQWHAEELAQLQAEVGMLRCHTEQMGPQLPPTILPPPVAPLLPPALTAPELFTEPPGPALETGNPTAPSHSRVTPGLPLAPFLALEDPPPAQEPPLQHRAPQSPF